MEATTTLNTQRKLTANNIARHNYAQTFRALNEARKYGETSWAFVKREKEAASDMLARVNRSSEKAYQAYLQTARSKGARSSLHRIQYRGRNYSRENCETGIYLLTAVSKVTGEIREYYCLDAEEVKNIGNLDYIAYGYEENIYYTEVKTTELNDNNGWFKVDMRASRGRKLPD